MAELAPFVWRKHLDFAALADVHDMKRQMQTYRGQSEIAVEGHNVKVGRGGIREIEFFAQTPAIDRRRATPAFAGAADAASLAGAGDQQLDHVSGAGRTHHRLRIFAPRRAPLTDIADEQTHALPDEPEAVERFANFFGYESRAAFAKDLLGHLKTVQGITASCSRAIRPAR